MDYLFAVSFRLEGQAYTLLSLFVFGLFGGGGVGGLVVGVNRLFGLYGVLLQAFF